MKRLRRSEPVQMTFEHSMLRTATFCLLALGAVMVYSASSGTSLLAQSGDSSYYLKRYLLTAVIGVVAMGYFSRHGLELVRRLTPIVMIVALAGLFIVLVPGIGVTANGARRWLGAGPFQVQPSEIAKLALVLYSANLIAQRPTRIRSFEGFLPLLLVAALISGLVVLEPDLGTAIVICLTLGAMLVAGGANLRHLALLVGAFVALALLAIMMSSYRRERLGAFLDPWADPRGSGFQSVQAMIAIGSGGPFGVGLGQSVQKLFYLPEAHTDMILAVIGEELGMAGISVVLFLYGMIAYAGLRAARMAKDLYAKLVAAGITSVILTQATLNFFAVLGVMPLTGVPLPFISYGNSNLIVLLASMGILINIAQTGGASAARPRLEVVKRRSADSRSKRQRSASPPATKRKPAQYDESLDRSRRDRRSRRAGARGRRRAAG
jgi:cell division protein FtsW